MKKKMILMPIFFIAMVIVIGFAVMYLWNWLMPEIFDLQTINYWQAMGILVLSKILFGGCGHKSKCCGSKHGNQGQWKHKFKHKWSNMSEEDKSKWQEKFGYCCEPKSKKADDVKDKSNTDAEA